MIDRRVHVSEDAMGTQSRAPAGATNRRERRSLGRGRRSASDRRQGVDPGLGDWASLQQDATTPICNHGDGNNPRRPAS